MTTRDRIADAIANAAEERMEEIAQREAESCDKRFQEWLCDQHDVCDLMQLISAALVVDAVGKRDQGATEQLSRECERIRSDYRCHRIATGDLTEIIAGIEDELRDQAEYQHESCR